MSTTKLSKWMILEGANVEIDQLRVCEKYNFLQALIRQ